jgi:Rrf2 family transcriptional regulator, iron-sulfur cluster assembly transcription factor
MLYLARRRADGLVPATDVTAALGTPPNYTGKILRRLARKGLLRSVRGPHGGFSLAVAPEAITPALIAEAVDEVGHRPSMCLLGDQPCDPDEPCALHDRWTALLERAGRPMEKTSVADLLNGGGDVSDPPTTNADYEPLEATAS